MRTNVRFGPAFLAFLLAMAPLAQARAESIRLSAGAMGQSVYMLTAVLAKWMQEAVPGLQASVIAGGGKANLDLVEKGKVDIGFTTLELYDAASKGEAPFKHKYTGIRHLVNFQGTSAFYFMVTKDTGLTSIHEIIEKKYPLKIATFLRSGPPEVDTRRVLEAYKINYDTIKKWGGSVNHTTWADAVNLLRDGHVNALLGKTGLPSPYHAEAAKARPMRMLALDAEQIDWLKKKYGYLDSTIPKGLYGIVEQDQPSIGSAYFLLVSPKMPDNIAYEAVKQMDLHADDIRKLHVSFKNFDPAKMATEMRAPPHPGALRYFKEKGWVK
jgi:TRAP transporter TAXI family solute receptor